MKKWMGVIVVLMVIFIAGMLIGQYWHNDSVSAVKTSQTRKILYWVAPMDPSYRRDKPGKSPMGMDLVPVYANGDDSDTSAVTISPAVESNLGVKTADVARRDLSRIIDTVGYVTVDENNIEHIHSYTDGWVKVLNVKTTGEYVHEGQLLLELYSPTLNNAQEELLLALKNNNRPLIQAGEKKLATLGMAQSQIDQLKRSRRVTNTIKIHATRNGIVSLLNVREGKFVKPDTDIMTIEDLSRIWIIAEVFEEQANWVRADQTAIATLPYIPGKVWQGKVDYVYPQLDAKTHTLRIRLVFPNPDLTIKPHMYANVKIFGQTVNNALAIPRAALIQTQDGDRVVLSQGLGRFKPQTVKVGIESGNYYQILSGLKEGEKIVTSAQFLIDSESSLKEGLSRMSDQNPAGNTGSKSPDVPQEFVGMGKVQNVDIGRRRITIRHQPIPSLDMPEMTMTLAVHKGVDLQTVKAGDAIHFVLIRNADKQYLVTKIHVMVEN
ncbi:efflux RND transporter periplasmic adaptor subunit [Legionella spiritensis]|uniref:Copper/silver efflux system, membrane fusion protein n=1 Tax=Legionella spiritensis TaxID=452 RepID=A0A0W0YW66_LEGSP|nr:efflux RND transporter periplasmic adaptor subunit [Legionella spiritensis]KTD61116.1 copper/silver efflux system, membrane fusion protein [Legionella spiritensis]SNV44994.1 copper/silver efflux system, membrane fusion protein [Legionella spiritensis]VEG90892.1 copper/silver efflux system, membrane fusion protein [Legionella spiritensis]